jgi:integrase
MRVTREFRRLVRVLDVPVIRLHSLRHTHASLLLAQGAPMKLVSERLGHAKIAMTMDNYAHLLPTMDGEATANLDASLREARRGPA